jgi:hypothetical protein
MKTIWKCADRRCTWQGTQKQKLRVPIIGKIGANSIVCPACKGHKFYWTAGAEPVGAPLSINKE